LERLDSVPGSNRVIVVDNYSLLRSELKAILEHSRVFDVVGEAGNGFDLLNLLHRGVVPDVVLLDLMMPKMPGIEALGELRRLGYRFKVLVLTMHREPELLCRSFNAGANGYMLKDGIAKELIHGLHTVLDGKIHLSPSMKMEMPDTCNIKAFAGKKPSAEFVHCK
jgi:two-component system, NarL family, response regulator NreC